MNRNERFKMAYEHLIGLHIISSQKDLAKRMGSTESYISNAMNGYRNAPSPQFLASFNKEFRGIFNPKWLTNEEGTMLAGSSQESSNPILINQATANNSPNAVVNASYAGDIVVSEDNTLDNKYGDSPLKQRNWCPVVPSSMARQPNFDIIGHITKQKGGNLERLYSGTACIDIWHYIEDNDLYPFYQKGDCIGLKAYDIGDIRIKTGDVYVVDTKRDGLITRRMRLNDNGDIVTFTYNDTDPQEFIIPKDDIIRLYRKVIMFRY